jgi:chromate transporter
MIQSIRPGKGVAYRDAVRVWARVAALSFGGPAGQIAVIHRILVEEKRWVSERRFLNALSYCMLLPGPEAQQLATYLGWLLHGARGGLTAGLLFILPGFVAVLVLSVLYAGYRDLAVVGALFYGLKPAVMAIVFEAVLRLRRRALVGPASVPIAAAAFACIFALGVPFPVIILGAAIAGVLAGHRGAPGAHEPLAGEITHDGAALSAAAAAPPSLHRFTATAALWLSIWLVPVALVFAAFGAGHVIAREAVFFSKAAVVTFGGAYAVLAYIAQQAVDAYGWLTALEMLDGLGLAETTPGPLIMVVQFVGYLAAFRSPGELAPMMAGVIGSVVTTWVTFAPSFLFILAGAPYVEVLAANRRLSAALTGVMAAVVGVVLNLAVWFGIHTLFGRVNPLEWGPLAVPLPAAATIEIPAVLLAGGAFLAVFRYRIGMIPVLVGAAVAGVVVHAVLARL